MEANSRRVCRMLPRLELTAVSYRPNRSSKGGRSAIPEVPRGPSPCSLPPITSVPSPHPIFLASISSTPYPQTSGILCPPDNPFPSPKSQDFRSRGSLKSRLPAPDSWLSTRHSQLLTDPLTGRGLAPAPVEQNQKHAEGSTPQYFENSLPARQSLRISGIPGFPITRLFEKSAPISRLPAPSFQLTTL
jgi:hypothetical protein